MPFTESHFENAVLQLFQAQLGYTYIYGPDVARDYRSPLYEDILLPCLRRVNPALPMDALNEAVYKLKNFESGTLLQKNGIHGLPAKWRSGEILCERRGMLRPRLPGRFQKSCQQ